MSKRIKVSEGAGGVIAFHLGENGPVHTFEVKDGFIEVPDEVGDQLDEAHRAIGFEVVEG